MVFVCEKQTISMVRLVIININGHNFHKKIIFILFSLYLFRSHKLSLCQRAFYCTKKVRFTAQRRWKRHKQLKIPDKTGKIFVLKTKCETNEIKGKSYNRIYVSFTFAHLPLLSFSIRCCLQTYAHKTKLFH